MTAKRATSAIPVSHVLRVEGGFQYQLWRRGLGIPGKAGPVVATEKDARSAGEIALVALKNDPEQQSITAAASKRPPAPLAQAAVTGSCP